MKPAVRLARNADGPEIARLLKGMGFQEELDWSDIEPYWLVAEMEGRIVGCLQIVLAKPVGWLELMGYDKGLSHRQKALVVRALTDKGRVLLAGFGSQMVMGSIPDEEAGYMRVAERRGWARLNSGFLYGKRVS